MRDNYNINIKVTNDKRIKTTMIDSCGDKVASFTFEASAIKEIVAGYNDCLQALNGDK